MLNEYEKPKVEPKKGNKAEGSAKPGKTSDNFLFNNAPAVNRNAGPPLPKIETNNVSGMRKPPMPLFSDFNSNFEPKRASNVRGPAKTILEDSLGIDEILNGRSNQPTQPERALKPVAPTRNPILSPRKTDYSDIFSDEPSGMSKGNYGQRYGPTEGKNNPLGKGIVNLNPDDYFSTASNNNRESSATKPPHSTSKQTAKQYYLNSSRYKPG